MLGAVEDFVLESYDRATGIVAERIDTVVAQAKRGEATARTELESASQILLNSFDMKGRDMIGTAVRAANAWGWITCLLIGMGVLNALLLALARISFHRPFFVEAGGESLRFSVSGRVTTAPHATTNVKIYGESYQATSDSVGPTMRLADAVSRHKKTSFLWYIVDGDGFLVRGKNVQPDGFLYRFLQAPISRFRHGRSLLSRCDVSTDKVQLHAPGLGHADRTGISCDAPRVSMTRVGSIVAVGVSRELGVIFSVRDLVGFTEGVRIETRFSTFAGNPLLGLGSFYNVAVGDGVLALSTDGTCIPTGASSGGDDGQSEPETALLAWDQEALFGLEQPLHPFLTWVNPANLRLATPQAVLCDQGGTTMSRYVRYWGRLAKYVLVPF